MFAAVMSSGDAFGGVLGGALALDAEATINNDANIRVCIFVDMLLAL